MIDPKNELRCFLLRITCRKNILVQKNNIIMICLLIFASNQYEQSHIDYYQYLRDRDAGFFPKSQCLISSEKKLFFEKKTNEGVSFFSEGVIRHAGFSLNDKWQMSACPLRQTLFYFWSRFSEASRLRAPSFLQEK